MVRYLSVIASFSPTSTVFLELVTDLLDVVYMFFNEAKIALGILTKLWYPGMSCEVTVVSFVQYVKDTGHITWIC